MQKVSWHEDLRSCKTPQVLRENFSFESLSRPVKRKVESEEGKKKVKVPEWCIDEAGEGYMVKVYPEWLPADGVEEEDCETPRELIEEAQMYLWSQVVDAILDVSISH